MKLFLKSAITLVLFASLSSCFSPVKISSKAYVIKAIPAVAIHRTRPVTILVMTPDSTPAYNTTQMSYSVKPYQISYYAVNRWAETPPQMLQELIVKTLQKTNYFHAVVTPPFVAQYDYTLMTYIVRLDQNYTVTPPMTEFAVDTQITRASTGRVIASKQFLIREPIWQCTPYGNVLATNRATERLLRGIAAFSMRAIH